MSRISEATILVMSLIALILVFIVFFILYSPGERLEFNIESQSRELTLDMMLNNIVRTPAEGGTIRDLYAQAYEACDAHESGCQDRLGEVKDTVEDTLSFAEHTFTDVVTPTGFVDCTSIYRLQFSPNEPEINFRWIDDRFGDRNEPFGSIKSQSYYTKEGAQDQAQCLKYMTPPNPVTKRILLKDGTSIYVTLEQGFRK
ncbi:MAG: hypothetical protein ACQESG_02855 [Nanobdellota archaeon]